MVWFGLVWFGLVWFGVLGSNCPGLDLLTDFILVMPDEKVSYDFHSYSCI